MAHNQPRPTLTWLQEDSPHLPELSEEGGRLGDVESRRNGGKVEDARFADETSSGMLETLLTLLHLATDRVLVIETEQWGRRLEGGRRL